MIRMLECLSMEPAGASPQSLEAAEDAELASRASGPSGASSRQAEEELCRRLGPRIRLYGLRHLRDEQAAADLVQQVLLIMLQGLRAGRLREPGKITSFVLGTSRMVVLEIRRGGARRAELLEQFRRESLNAVASTPLLDLDRLRACLEQLPARERSVVALTFYREDSGDEVAQSLGLSAANVRVIRHRAIGRLRSCMGVQA